MNKQLIAKTILATAYVAVPSILIFIIYLAGGPEGFLLVAGGVSVVHAVVWAVDNV